MLRTFAWTMYYYGGPGRERDAALAWELEVKYEHAFLVGQSPEVTYSDGIYAVTGSFQSSHPSTAPAAAGSPGDAQNLDSCVSPERQERMRAAYARRRFRWDGTCPPARQH